MSVEEIRVSGAWLSLREPADAAARAGGLVERLGDHLPMRGRRVIHDLACGTGAMGRWLAPRLAGGQRWVLHDRDPGLLELAAAQPPGRAADGASVAVETVRSDITLLDADDLAGADLITASALLDLLTADELDGLIAVCAETGCPVLLSLSVVGRVALSPPDPLDARMAAAFNAHQRRLTTRGPLLGPDAVSAAARGFRRRGADVVIAASPWRLGAADADLAAEWLRGWIGAACEHEAAVRKAASAYAHRRLAQIRGGALAVTVDHADVLVLP